MSEKLCALRKIGGGTLKETVLWTNSNPTSSFAQQDVSLSDSITNYKYIKFVIRNYTNVSTTTSYIFPSDEVATFAVGTTAYIRRGFIGGRTNGNTARTIMYRNNTTLVLSANLNLNEAKQDDKGNIPVQIIGIK